MSKEIDPQPQAVAYGDSQLTLGVVSQGFGEAPAGYVSGDSRFVMGPQYSVGEPFSVEVTTLEEGESVNLVGQIQKDELAESWNNIETLMRAQQIGSRAVGRRRFRLRHS